MNEQVVAAAKEIVIKHAKQMALELVEAALIPALEAAVEKSATPIDNVVLAALKQPLKDGLVELISQVK